MKISVFFRIFNSLFNLPVKRAQRLEKRRDALNHPKRGDTADDIRQHTPRPAAESGREARAKFA
jgi:hypothetical protein